MKRPTRISRQWILAVTLTVLGCGSGETTTTGTASIPAPIADFTVSVSQGVAPLTVDFTDTSMGSITSRSWTFGDGTTSTATHPSHTFSAVGSYTVALTALGPGGSTTKTQANCVIVTGPTTSTAWRFAVVGDTHVQPSAYGIPTELAAAILADSPRLVLVPGDIVDGGLAATGATLKTELELFQSVMSPLTRAGIPVYPIRGNHEDDAKDDLTAWNAVFTGTAALPSNGPAGEENLTYSFTKNNALFIGLDQYVNLHQVNQTWLNAQLAANTRPHVFVFGHEPAFKVFHTDCLDDLVPERDAFWKSLAASGARTYFCGHDHFFDMARLDDGDGEPNNDLFQVLVGSGGGDLHDKFNYVGSNSTYIPTQLSHLMNNGYLLVELSGETDSDLNVTLTFKQRVVATNGTVSYAPAYSFTYTAASKLKYPVVDTGQVATYNATTEITAPAAGAAFYGQDAQHAGLSPSYKDNGDGTLSDLNTGLMWVKARGPKTSWAAASTGASSCVVGGYGDWRMPTIKELYSLILFTGAQGPSLYDPAGYLPFIDSSHFDFVFGAGTTTERIIDCQDWSSTVYVGTIMANNQTAAFGVNFADGRIKGYPTTSTNYVRYVRGNPNYGQNEFRNNGDGTITDLATRLMWSQTDSAVGLDWQSALAWVQAKNALAYLGHNDWRLPNAKELQSLVDYSHAPKASDIAKQGPALDPIFACTAIPDEAGGTDYPFYWTSTSFKDGTPGSVPAAYVTFGRALGFMKPIGSTSYQLLDVHGAGAQRSDPKAGNVTDYLLGTDASGHPVYGRGPQGDVVRINNFVRLVRDAR